MSETISAEELEMGVASETISRYRLYLRQRPAMLVVLLVLAAMSFAGVTALSRLYRAQRESLGSRWFNRGVADLQAGKFDAAVTEFRSALLYSRDNYSYQLNLAEALIGMRHTGEATAYLLNLWDREPDNGLVNLELARIASQQERPDDAIRYYHNAVYAAWPSDEERIRSGARLELIELLLHIGATTQAQSELIALAENAGDDPQQQQKIGDLFQSAQDYEHALTAYRVSLRSSPHSATALAGAGRAALELARYPLAQRYLQEAVKQNPGDAESSERLKTAQMVLNMDPFRRQISAAERSRIVVNAFQVAGQRLKSCPVRRSPGSGPSLSDDWTTLSPRVTQVELRRDADLVESAMETVFRIERETSSQCGVPSGPDLALLLIAKSHEGN